MFLSADQQMRSFACHTQGLANDSAWSASVLHQTKALVADRATGKAAASVGYALLAVAIFNAPAYAQSRASEATTAFPSKTITLLVNGGPGSLPDIFARPLADNLRQSLGQTVVVDNRPGAGGMVAMQRLKDAKADGHTLAIITNAHAVWNPYVFPNLTYSPNHDLTPVSPIAILPMAMVVNPQLGVGSVQELVAKAKAESGVLNYASSGNGSPPHVLFEVWRNQAGIEIEHIPFKTGTDALTSTVAGDTQVYFAGTALVEAMVRANKLKVLAVSPSVDSSAFAAAETMEQAGFAGYESAVWLGVVAPAKTPDAIVQTLNTAIAVALTNPRFASIIQANGSIPLHESASDFAQRIDHERQTWGPQIEHIGIRPN